MLEWHHTAFGIATATTVSEFESCYSQQFSLLHIIQTSLGAHPASYPMSAGSSFPGGKAAGA
jgi:hypothetical protein